jgi:hypothetical protein
MIFGRNRHGIIGFIGIGEGVDVEVGISDVSGDHTNLYVVEHQEYLDKGCSAWYE